MHMESDREAWYKYWSDKNEYWKGFYLQKKMKPAEIFKYMNEGNIKFPTTFKLKKKLFGAAVIRFDKQADLEPEVGVRGRHDFISRRGGKQYVQGLDLGKIKQAINAAKDIAAGGEGKIISGPEEYFKLVTDAMWELFYDKMSERYLKNING